MATIQDILQGHLPSWLKAKDDRKKRGEIVRLVFEAIRIHPKSIPRAFRRLQLKGDETKRSGRPRLYTNDVISALKDTWELGDHCCGELLHPMIPEYVSVLKRLEKWPHTESATKKLLSMSQITVKRRTLHFQKTHGIRRGMSSTKPSSLKSIIPIFKGPWKDIPSGNGQVDTVAHCGDTLLGDFIFTLNYTDVPTYWMIPRAQWNKGQTATQKSIESMRSRLPFPLLGIHPDTGSEFINWHLLHWCEVEKITMTRSEPGKKNDNMCVEERNGHVVRKYIGYERLDIPEIVPILNELYDYLSLYLNHYKAVRRQVKRERVGSKYVKTYEPKAKTPYQRVLEHTDIFEEVKRKLKEEHEHLNPLQLLKDVDTLRTKIYHIQKAAREQKGGSS